MYYYWIFPNPNRSGYFTIINKGKEISNVLMEVFSLSGQLIESKRITNFDKMLQLNISNQKAGTFIVKISSSEKIFRKTIVKLEVE